MPGRSFNADGQRHLFHGMEQDGEVSGSGNSYTTEFRQYDPRLGRWKSLDPLMGIQPHLSPYQAFNNNPIYFVDPLGLIGGPPNEYSGSDKIAGILSSTVVFGVLGSYFDWEFSIVWSIHDWINGEHSYNFNVMAYSFAAGGGLASVGYFIAGFSGVGVGFLIGSISAIIIQKTIGIVYNSIINYRIKQNQEEWDYLLEKKEKHEERIRKNRSLILDMNPSYNFDMINDKGGIDYYTSRIEEIIRLNEELSKELEGLDEDSFDYSKTKRDIDWNKNLLDNLKEQLENERKMKELNDQIKTSKEAIERIKWRQFQIKRTRVKSSPKYQESHECLGCIENK